MTHAGGKLPSVSLSEFKTFLSWQPERACAHLYGKDRVRRVVQTLLPARSPDRQFKKGNCLPKRVVDSGRHG